MLGFRCMRLELHAVNKYIEVEFDGTFSDKCSGGLILSLTYCKTGSGGGKPVKASASCTRVTGFGFTWCQSFFHLLFAFSCLFRFVRREREFFLFNLICDNFNQKAYSTRVETWSSISDTNKMTPPSNGHVW